MTAGAIQLFYSYAHEDAEFLNQLDTHLVPLKRDGLIQTWYNQKIQAGSLRGKESVAHLQAAQIILLLLSPQYLASDSCYEEEAQKALSKHQTGTAHVLAVIVRPCVWKNTPLGQLQVLPKRGKPITKWANRDEAYTTIVESIQTILNDLRKPEGTKLEETTQKRPVSGGESGRRGMARTPQSIEKSLLKKAVNHYLVERDEYRRVAEYELGLRSAFQNLLATVAEHIGWQLAPEMTLGKIRPDGVILDGFRLRRGYWEAKGPKTNLEKEIKRKIDDKYPLTNTIFEDSKTAILYQNKKRVSFPFNLDSANDIYDLLQQFFTYVEPDIENFEEAVNEFKERIPENAEATVKLIQSEHKQNRQFQSAFSSFAQLCRDAIDPHMGDSAINEMLVQHLLTERLFRTIFNNPDFVRRNAIAAEIEKVVDVMALPKPTRNEFFKSLDRFYVAIERAAKGIESWSERQEFLNTVYEHFFQGFFVKHADTHGIVYTPQEIVAFMCASVEDVLQKEFSRSLSEPGVQILDPCTGTGNFIVNLIRNHINRRDLKYKYQHDLFCNEVMLLPYYVASLNIEHEYYTATNEYAPFEGICFADTLELAEDRQLSLFVEENTERVKREKEANITVVIGNPPYNVGQKNENDNNKNRKYKVIDGQIKETYAKDSRASNKNALSDAYVKFFRWATDRLRGQDGIVCFVSNNSFIDAYAFDGFRKCVREEFSSIYHIDLGGNARKQGGGNVFNIMVGVGITLFVRKRQGAQPPYPPASIYYHKVDDDLKGTAKLKFLSTVTSIKAIEWQELQPDEKHTWLTSGMQIDFDSFLPIGTKEAKREKVGDIHTIFKNYGRGVATCRDDWAYDFDKGLLEQKIKIFIETYNDHVSRWQRRADSPLSVDDFVQYDDTKIKWSRDLKLDLQRGHYAEFSALKVRQALYRPYCQRFVFFDRILNEEVYQLPQIFPTPVSEIENVVIVISDIGYRAPFSTLATNIIPDLHLLAAVDAFQCFPYYTYSEDGTNRRENITDWALTQFQSKYGQHVNKWDIFHYIYAILHHPHYREHYAENLKRDLPHIPLVKNNEIFAHCIRIGKALMDLHLNYEEVKEYRLAWQENKEVPFSWEVKKMRLTADKTAVIVNESLTLAGIPPACFHYRLGNRSALEWVIDQYQASTDKRSGIVSDPNKPEDEEYIARLIGRVVTVSLETVNLVAELEQKVRMEDWLEKEALSTDP
jgi:predicted helicase